MGLRARRLVAMALGAMLCVSSTINTSAAAQQDVVLMRLLRDSQSFRVRARAAIALAHIDGAASIFALEAALQDPHEAVRSAAASALGEIGTRRSVPALRFAASDASPDVADRAKQALRLIASREVKVPAPQTSAPLLPARPSGVAALQHVRYAVVLGDMRQREGLAEQDMSEALGALIGEELRKLDTVAVFTMSEMTDEVVSAIVRRKVPAFRLEGTLTKLDRGVVPGEYKTRCEVSLLLFDEPERTLRSLMKGAASGSEQPHGPAYAQQVALTKKTLRSAVQSAMRNAAQAIEAAAIRKDLGMSEADAAASLGKRRPSRRAR